MKMIWLQAFWTAVKYNGFSAAAEEMFTSQANISKYISSLEKDLGIELFDRSTRNAKLTDEGNAILPYVEKMIEDYSGLQQCIAERRSLEESAISVYSVPIVHAYDLPSVLVEFSQNHPEVELEMVETDVYSVLQGLEEKENSIGIMRTCAIQMLPKTIKWKTLPFISDELVLLCNKNSRFATGKAPSLAECMDEKLIVLERGFYEYRLLLMDYGIPSNSFNPAIKCASPAMLSNYVEKDLCISLITRAMARKISDNENLVVRSLVEAPSFPLSIVTRTDTLAPAALSLIQKMIDASNEKKESVRALPFG